MNSVNVAIVHPAFERLRQNGSTLHLVAGSLILLHACLHILHPDPDLIYFGCLLLVAIDIFILVLAVGKSLADIPGVNLFFRAIECLFFAGIGIEMLVEGRLAVGLVHVAVAAGYICLFRIEQKMRTGAWIGIYHSGIVIPALWGPRFLSWSAVSSLDAGYRAITITTAKVQYAFDLRKQLQFDELDQIHEFCRYYIGE